MVIDLNERELQQIICALNDRKNSYDRVMGNTTMGQGVSDKLQKLIDKTTNALLER